MPGGSGDARDSCVFYDQSNGRILHEKEVEMVQEIDRFAWSSTNLSITLFADWSLPK